MFTDTDIKKLKGLLAPLATKKELVRLHETLATKKDLLGVTSDVLDLKADMTVLRSDMSELKSDMKALRETVQEMAITVDKFMKIALARKEEHATISAHLTRHERWFKEIAKKTGISFEI